MSCPDKINSKEELTTMCAMVMFHSSVRHSSVNFPSFDYACFAPVSPVCMRGDIPLEGHRGKITEQDIIDCLPDTTLNIQSAGIAMRTSEYSKDEVFLLQKEKKKKSARKSWFGTALKLSRLSLRLAPKEKNMEKNIEKDPSQDDCNEIKENLESANLATPIQRNFLPPRWLFNEENVIQAFASFQKRLQQIEDEIEQRNKELEIPYAVLLPSKIPFGIAI